VFVEVADTLVDDFDLIEFLQMLTSRTAELAGAAAAGLLLADQQGNLQFMAASEEDTKMLELFQVQNHEGPYQDCFRTGRPVANADLGAAADRWPVFAPRAVEAGFGSVYAIPMRLRTETIGALNLFGDGAGGLQPDGMHIVQALADVATIGLLQERAVRRGEVLTEQLQSALNSRIIIEQAKGVIAQIYTVDINQAFELLRGYSRRHHLRIGNVARALVTDPASIPNLTAV
jgi:GAF domain-containing protein